MINAPVARQLESLVDSYSLASIAATLAEIAAEKAEHIRTNWQARHLASSWDRDARKLDSLKLEN